MQRPPDPQTRSQREGGNPPRANRYVEQKFEQPESTILAWEVRDLRRDLRLRLAVTMSGFGTASAPTLRSEAAGLGRSIVASTAEALDIAGRIVRSEAAAEAGALL
jgi:hypothetical protein